MAQTITVSECTPADYRQALSAVQQHASESVSFLQAPFCGAWQEADGKNVIYYVARSNDKILAAGLAIQYDAPGGLHFLYSPYGPVVETWTPELLAALRRFFKPVAKRTGNTFVRLDSPGLTALNGVRSAPSSVAATASLQPRSEWLLDLTQTEEALLAGMHKHARYNIRLAERAKAVCTLYAPDKAPLDMFYKLMQTTSTRDSFGIMSKDYYGAVFNALSPEDGFVAICTIDGKPAAAALFVAYDQQIHYVFAGSSNDFRKIAPAYFLMWNAITESKRRGLKTFNFGGVRDHVKKLHLEGVTGFKKRFGGYQVDHENPVDLVYRPFSYMLFRLYKAVRYR